VQRNGDMQQNNYRVELNGLSVELDGTILHGEADHHREPIKYAWARAEPARALKYMGKARACLEK